MNTNGHGFITSSQFQQGVLLLKQPLLPVVKILQFLYLTGPFTNVSSLVEEFVEPIEIGNALYKNPTEMLRPFTSLLQNMERIKNPQEPAFHILDEDLRPLESLEAVELWIAHNLVTQELETINTLLCGPCHCTICCIGPDSSMSQLFFEIPLHESEISLFKIPAVSTEESKTHTSLLEPPLYHNNRPFYEAEPNLFHWQTGWSLILPKESSCPHLSESGACRIYTERPETCRRPQIFPYVLERNPDHDQEKEGKTIPAYIKRKKILAIWDCPYVRALKGEIATYAEMCELEPVFRENKN